MGWSDLMLATTPRWGTTYTGIHKAKYAEHNGMFFEVTQNRLFGWWHVDRIDSAGRYLGETATGRTLNEVKDLIRIWNGALPPELVTAMKDREERLMDAETV